MGKIIIEILKDATMVEQAETKQIFCLFSDLNLFHVLPQVFSVIYNFFSPFNVIPHIWLHFICNQINMIH